MIYNNISSSVLVSEILDEYGIQSSDFINNVPNWTSACIDDFVPLHTLSTHSYTNHFDNNRCILPDGCKTIEDVFINGIRATYQKSFYISDKNLILNKELGTIENNNYNSNSSVESLNVVDTIYPKSCDALYYTSNDWLHTTIENGNIHILYKKFSSQFDPIFGIEFPIIPDEYNTKNAIKAYILKTLLMRGYKHGLLSLKENNPALNPSIMYATFRKKAMVLLSRVSKQDISNMTHGLLGSFSIKNISRVTAPNQTVLRDLTFDIANAYYTITSTDYVTSIKTDLKAELDINPIVISELVREEDSYLYLSIPNVLPFVLLDENLNDISQNLLKIDTDTTQGVITHTVYKLISKLTPNINHTFNLAIRFYFSNEVFIAGEALYEDGIVIWKK